MEVVNRLTVMIEERIRKEVRPEVEVMADALHKRLEAELSAIGVSHWRTCMHQLVQEAREGYAEKLINDRYSDLVSRLLNADATAADASLVDIVRAEVKRGGAEMVDKLQRAGRI